MNAWSFVPLDFVLLLPALSGLRSGQPAVKRWMRIYLSLRLALIALVGLGVFEKQDNAAFALAAASVFLGLSALPSAEPESAGLQAKAEH